MIQVIKSPVVKISGQSQMGVPLPFFRFRGQKGKYFLSAKQIEHTRSLFRKHGIGVWKEWAVSELLHEDYIDMKDDLEKIDVTMDDEFQNGLFWFVVLGQESRPIHRKKCDLVLEGVDSASEWLAQTCFSQSRYS